MEEVCDQLRGLYAVDGVPVDVWKLAKGMGICVREREWTGKPHAVCVPECRLIILNARRSETSRRFDLAHELGHFVLPESAWHTEAENRFAAALLMPGKLFKLELLIAGHVVHVAGIFGVGQRAARVRARELGWRG